MPKFKRYETVRVKLPDVLVHPYEKPSYTAFGELYLALVHSRVKKTPQCLIVEDVKGWIHVVHEDCVSKL